MTFSYPFSLFETKTRPDWGETDWEQGTWKDICLIILSLTDIFWQGDQRLKGNLPAKAAERQGSRGSSGIFLSLNRRLPSVRDGSFLLKDLIKIKLITDRKSSHEKLTTSCSGFIFKILTCTNHSCLAVLLIDAPWLALSVKMAPLKFEHYNSLFLSPGGGRRNDPEVSPESLPWTWQKYILTLSHKSIGEKKPPSGNLQWCQKKPECKWTEIWIEGQCS